MKQFNVTGMSCAACSARVEKAVSKVEGVTSCSVSLLTNSMGVEGTAADEAIIKAVEEAGYGASAKGRKNETSNADESLLEDRETPKLKRRLFVSLGFLIVLMYVSMGHSMWGLLLPSFLEGNPLAIGLTQMILAAIVMVINQKFFISGFKALLSGGPNMDTLVAMGSSAAFVYSVFALFLMTGSMAEGDMEKAHSYLHEFYFESAAMILTLITVGKMLEARAKGRTTNALKGLMKLSPKTARIMRNGEEEIVSIEEVVKGDIFIVRPGDSIPVDGIVIEGSGAVNESALTGESIPVDKEEGDRVSAATINQSGYLKCEAVRVGEDTTLSQIIQMVSDAAATKAPVAKVADRVSGIFVPVVIGIAAVTLTIWLLLGRSFGFAIARAISVLVISCPCALGLATPVAIMVGNGKGANNGILFKTAQALEETGKTKIIALDKTGTITEGTPVVTDICPAEGIGEDELLRTAYSVERMSEHPLARAIVEMAEEKGVEYDDVSGFSALPGNGLTGIVRGQVLFGGSRKFISSKCNIGEADGKKAEDLAGEGKTPLFFSLGGSFMGMIAVADTLKSDSPEAISELRNMGINVVMLTGDNERTANAIGRSAGVDDVVAGVLPDGKEAVVRTLMEKGKTVMVGDGINDAPALTRADVGIAIGAGTDVAIDAADIVLMKNSLKDVAAAVRLSRATLRNIYENLFWAFIYNIICIPVAAGALIPFGITLNPMLGAAAMSLSSFFVVSNALRLNLFRLYDASKDKAPKDRTVLNIDKKEFTGGNEMEKIMDVKGMMCIHCEARVKKALEKIEGVTEATASHETGKVVVKMSTDIPAEILKKAVEDQDYEVVSVN